MIPPFFPTSFVQDTPHGTCPDIPELLDVGVAARLELFRVNCIQTHKKAKSEHNDDIGQNVRPFWTFFTGS